MDNMKVEKNKVVALSYTLVVDGAVADSASAEKPLEYIHGTGMLLPRFEEEVAGKEPGEEYAFTLSPEEGYGVHNPQQVIDIPLAAFMIDGEVRRDLLVVGRTIPMMNQDGHVLQGTVAAVKEDSVSMDFNHPMAGKTLNFSGKVVSVREATEKELTEGLHGEYLPREEHCCKKNGGKCHKHEGEGEHECCQGEGEGCCEKGEGCCKD